MTVAEVKQLHTGDEVRFKREVFRIGEIEIVRQNGKPPIIVRIRRHDGATIEATPRELS